MEASLPILYGLFASLAILQSLLLLLQTWEHRRYAKSCLKSGPSYQPSGRVLVCAPCKGFDIDLEDHLRAVLEQDYDDYEVTFIVESPEDPACPAIRRVMADHPWITARMLVAGRAAASGQKVHNLRAATARLSPRIEYLAFVDSDARPRPNWLRLLISRLDRPGRGAVTGYRWFVPERPTMANHLLYSSNCDLLSLLCQSSHYLIWGGSWAIRREIFQLVGLRSAWQGMLSDDLVASRLLRQAGLNVRFEPSCIVASPVDHSLTEVFAFVRRQYLLGRFYLRDWWLFAIMGYTLSNVLWWGNVGVLAVNLERKWFPLWIPAAVVVAVYLLRSARGMLRQDLVRSYFPHLKRPLRWARHFDVWLHPLAGLFHWLAVLGSLFGREVAWRGIRYRLRRDGKIGRFWRESDPAVLPLPGLNAPVVSAECGMRNAECQA
ncbi:MAG: glycosyltransferase [Pirellulales bacterium]|nr:glycosyltransferase [Pirellulales bacterium]